MNIYRYFLISIFLMMYGTHALGMENHAGNGITFTYETDSSERPHELTVYAWVNNACVGSIVYSKIAMQPKYEKPYIRNILINKEYRRQGIGSTLLLHALEDLQKSGCTHVMLFAINDSESFYKKFGAHVIDRLMYSIMEFDFSRDGDPRINLLNSKNTIQQN